MSHEGYHRIETADFAEIEKRMIAHSQQKAATFAANYGTTDMPRPDVNYLLTRLEGQLQRAEIWSANHSEVIKEIIFSSQSYARLLREALSERHIDVT